MLNVGMNVLLQLGKTTRIILSRVLRQTPKGFASQTKVKQAVGGLLPDGSQTVDRIDTANTE